MKKLILILLCLPFICFGQGWIKSYINSGAYDVDCTNDGGYIICGTVLGSNESDIWILKLDSYGNEVWTKTVDSNERDECLALKQTDDGGYILSGYFGEISSSYGEIWVSKINSIGNPEWTNTYGSGRSINSIEQCSDGGFIFGGVGTDSKIIKTDNNGNIEWENIYVDLEDITHLTKTNDGGFIISGLDTTDISPCVIKIDSLGVKEWKKIYSSNNTDWQQISSVKEISGGIILVGEQEFVSGPNIGYNNVWLIKINAIGDILWEKSILVDSFPFVSARSIQQTVDGGFIISGFLVNQQNDDYIMLLKTDANGVKQWINIFGGSGMDASFSAQQTLDGGYIIAGLSQSHTVIKTDGSGNITSTFNIPINPNRKLQKTVDILGKETNGTNQPLLYLYDDGTVEKRITID